MIDDQKSCMVTGGRYKGNPVAVHQRIEGLEIGLFDRWLALFGETCDEMFDSDTAGALSQQGGPHSGKSQACALLSCRPALAG